MRRLLMMAILASTGSVFAQDAGSQKSFKNYFSLNLGAAVPVGQFAQQKSNVEGHGFAVTGFHLSLDYNIYLTPRAGLMVSAGTSFIGANEPGFQKNFVNELPQWVTVAPGTTFITSSISKGWRQQFVLVGPVVSFPLQDLVVDFHAQGGLNVSSAPEFGYTTLVGSTQSSFLLSSVSKSVFAFKIGGGIRVPVSEKIALRFDASYMGSSADKAYEVDDANGSGKQFDLTTGNQQMNMWLITWSVVGKIYK